MYFFFFKQKTAYEMRISDWSSDVCSSDLFENWGRSGFELVRRGRIFDVIATYCCDHLAAAEHWRHALEPAWLGIESPNARRPIKFVAGESKEIDVESRDVDCVVYYGLGSICEHRNAPFMGKPNNCLEWRTEEHKSELQSLMRITYAVFC